jgi:hypothetical protein
LEDWVAVPFWHPAIEALPMKSTLIVTREASTLREFKREPVGDM